LEIILNLSINDNIVYEKTDHLNNGYWYNYTTWFITILKLGF
jgi:hypothetical protein